MKKSSFLDKDPKVIILAFVITTFITTVLLGTMTGTLRLLWEALKYGWTWGGVF